MVRFKETKPSGTGPSVSSVTGGSSTTGAWFCRMIGAASSSRPNAEQLQMHLRLGSRQAFHSRVISAIQIRTLGLRDFHPLSKFTASIASLISFDLGSRDSEPTRNFASAGSGIASLLGGGHISISGRTVTETVPQSGCSESCPGLTSRKIQTLRRLQTAAQHRPPDWRCAVR